MNNLLYALEWSFYLNNSTVRDYDALLKTKPSNLFQLNFWCEVIMISKIQQLDIPENAVFYLSDQNYLPIIQPLSQPQKSHISLKLDLTSHIFAIKTSQSLIRKIQQTILTLCSIDKSQSQKTTAIKKFLESSTTFISASTLSKICTYLSYKINPQLQLKHISDSILPTFIIQQIINHSQSSTSTPNANANANANVMLQQIKKYLILHQKQKVVQGLKQHLGKLKNVIIMEIFIAYFGHFQQYGRVLEFFHGNQHIFYAMYQGVRANKQEGLYRGFSYFMNRFSCIRVLVLHQILYIGQIKRKGQEKGRDKGRGIGGTLASKNREIFQIVKQNPDWVSRKCLEYYLNMSGFGKVGNGDTLCDPLAYVAIKREYWQDIYHGQVINLCLWLSLQSLQNSFQQAKSQLKSHISSLYLLLFQISIGYTLGSFCTFYCIEHNQIAQLFSLQTLPNLLVCLPPASYPHIPWLPSFMGQLGRIFRYENGYQMVMKLIGIKIGNPQICYMKILHLMEADLGQRGSRFWGKNLKKNREWAKGILDQIGKYGGFGENVDRLRKMIQAVKIQYY